MSRGIPAESCRLIAVHFVKSYPCNLCNLRCQSELRALDYFILTWAIRIKISGLFERDHWIKISEIIKSRNKNFWIIWERSLNQDEHDHDFRMDKFLKGRQNFRMLGVRVFASECYNALAPFCYSFAWILNSRPWTVDVGSGVWIVCVHESVWVHDGWRQGHAFGGGRSWQISNLLHGFDAFPKKCK